MKVKSESVLVNKALSRSLIGKHTGAGRSLLLKEPEAASNADAEAEDGIGLRR